MACARGRLYHTPTRAHSTTSALLPMVMRLFIYLFFTITKRQQQNTKLVSFMTGVSGPKVKYMYTIYL